MDNTDVNVYRFKGADTFLTFTDFHLMNEIDLRTLRTIGSAQFGAQDDAPEGAFFSSSHPGEYVHSTGVYLINWLGVKTARGSTLSVYTMGADMVRRVVGSVDHSCHTVSTPSSW
jgi:carotenoid cleavage dioxygenase-like enzyme